jgi:adenine-specific DNA glycosylase
VETLLLAWFAANGRDLPWRRTRDAYAILVSEVMLQQTQVERVIPRYLAWLERWPTAEALAGASPAQVIRAWQGLGYNRRGLNLHRAARIVAERGWPDDLTELPGVGPYTAAAVACFAFGRDILPVDTNVRRVQERTGYAFSAGAGLPRARSSLRALPTREQVPVARPQIRAAAQAVAFRGLLPPAPCADAPPGRGNGETARPTRRRGRGGPVPRRARPCRRRARKPPRVGSST